ncbi:MAG: hypothetical protein R3F59_00610 [Myxococcota bacterium]
MALPPPEPAAAQPRPRGGALLPAGLVALLAIGAGAATWALSGDDEPPGAPPPSPPPT